MRSWHNYSEKNTLRKIDVSPPELTRSGAIINVQVT